MSAPQHQPLDLEHFLPYRLSVLSNRISQDIARLYQKRFGVSILEWRVMAVLGRFSGLSASVVAEHTAMDKVAVSRALNTMIERNLVLREFDSKDRRRSVLQLSDTGRAVHDEIVPLALQLESSLLQGFDALERLALIRLLDKLDAAELRAHG